MGLSRVTVSTLKACAPLLENHKQALGKTFYNNLFGKYPQLRNQFNMSGQMNNAQGNSLANAVVAYCANCDQLEALGPTVAKISSRHVSLEVTPEQYNVVGEVLLLSLEELLGKEVFNEEVKGAVAEGYFFLADIFKENEAKMIADRKAAEGGWHGWRRFQLAKKVPESSLHTSFFFAPEDGNKTVRFAGGQYTSIRLQLEDVDHLVVRSYTLSGSNKDQYRITVKREDGGLVSQFLHDKLQVGDKVELSAPAGEFTLQKGPQPRVFFGGGTGITPLMSMLREAAQDPATPALLIYRATKPLVHPLHQELLHLVESNEHISCTVMYDEDGEHLPLSSNSRVTVLPTSTPWTADAIGPLLPKGCQAYICGPPAFFASTRDLLQEVGLEQADIFFECFGPQA